MADSLLDQFVLESGECLADASDALLELEKRHGSKDAVDRLFRALHTLKGNAALFDMQPIVHVAHIAEDILDSVRKGKQAMSDSLADVIFSAIDQIGSWVTEIEHAGKLPPDAAARSDELHNILLAFSIDAATHASASSADFAWVSQLPAQAWLDASKREQPLVAVLYTPDPGCFFSGDDPLKVIRDLPGLCALHSEFGSEMPTLADLEVFNCYLQFMALSSAPESEVGNYCREYKDQMAVLAIPVADTLVEEVPDSTMLRQILETQLRILELPNLLEGNDGKLSACLKSIRNALHYMKLDNALVQLAAIEETLRVTQDLLPLRQFVSALIAGGLTDQQEEPAKKAEPSAKKFLQVEQGRIDQLLNLIGEMTAAKNNLQYLAERAESLSREFSLELKDRSALIEHITQEMQDIAVSFRMTPLSSIFKRLPRLVRDLGKELDRKVKLLINGGETEADRHVLDTLTEPLLHMLRNSMAHGIESATERESAGKPPTGLIRIKAFHRHNQLIIEVQDDGRGIDVQSVKQKAVASGIITEEEAERITDNDAMQLIFHSGFSLAKEVTNIAGRGVGMDVVKSTVENAGGTVSLHSEVGVGTTFTLALPLYIASAQMMTLRIADQLFGIPMQQVQQTLKVPRKSVRKIRNDETFIYRHTVTPLLRLHTLLDLPDAGNAELSVVVVRLQQGLGGLAVDEFCNPVEVVIKPLSGILKSLSNFSGSALLADNSVLLVLNLEELIGGH